MNMDILNRNLKITKITEPYTVWSIDDFLKEEVIENISKNWLEPDSVSWHKGHATVYCKKNN